MPLGFGSSTSTTTADGVVGIASFFDFFCSVFSRIAYVEDPLTLFLVSGVLRIIPQEIIAAMSTISDANFKIEDDVLFDLNANPSGLPIREYTDGDGRKRKAIDFMSYVKRINSLIEDTAKSPDYKRETDANVQIISIADSNYGDVLVIGIKTLQNLIFCSFRGTYSLKTAASYSRPDSIIPVPIDKTGRKLLLGIGKIVFEISHTIIDAMEYISKKFLLVGEGQTPIPVFTGHSLGGAMGTMMCYEYCKTIRERETVLNKKSICISFGSPRALGEKSSEELCGYVVSGEIIFHRFSNDGDPVTSLPPALPGLINFSHPCSSREDKKKGNRKLVSIDCKSSTTMRPLPKSEYTKSINCSDKEPSTLTKLANVAPNIADHMTYLYVSFVKAADVGHLFVGSALTFETTEIGRVPETNVQEGVKAGDTELRIDTMTGNGSSGTYKVSFEDLVNLREKTGKLAEDTRDSSKVFEFLETIPGTYKLEFGKDGLPNQIPKKADDSDLADAIQQYRLLETTPETEKRPYINPALEAGPGFSTSNTGAVLAQGGSYKRKNKTRKNKKAKKTRKGKKVKTTKKTRKARQSKRK